MDCRRSQNLPWQQKLTACRNDALGTYVAGSHSGGLSRPTAHWRLNCPKVIGITFSHVTTRQGSRGLGAGRWRLIVVDDRWTQRDQASTVPGALWASEVTKDPVDTDFGMSTQRPRHSGIQAVGRMGRPVVG